MVKSCSASPARISCCGQVPFFGARRPARFEVGWHARCRCLVRSGFFVATDDENPVLEDRLIYAAVAFLLGSARSKVFTAIVGERLAIADCRVDAAQTGRVRQIDAARTSRARQVDAVRSFTATNGTRLALVDRRVDAA